jgi:hypothetical protein
MIRERPVILIGREVAPIEKRNERSAFLHHSLILVIFF